MIKNITASFLHVEDEDEHFIRRNLKIFLFMSFIPFLRISG